MSDWPVRSRNAKVALEKRVVERARHRDGRKAEQAEEVAREFPVAVVASQNDERTIPSHQQVHHRLVPDDSNPVSPVFQMQFAWCVEDLHEHRTKMAIHPTDNLIALGARVLIAECCGEIFDAYLAMPLINSIDHPTQKARQCVRLLDREHLSECDHAADCQVGEVVDPESTRFRAGHMGHSVDSPIVDA